MPPVSGPINHATPYVVNLLLNIGNNGKNRKMLCKAEVYAKQR